MQSDLLCFEPGVSGTAEDARFDGSQFAVKEYWWSGSNKKARTSMSSFHIVELQSIISNY